MNRYCFSRCCALGLLLGLGVPLHAGPTTQGTAPLANPSTAPASRPAEDVASILPDRPDVVDMGDGLGPIYLSSAAGITMRAPAGCVLLGRVDADHLAEWQNEKRHWSLKLSRLALDQPRPLQSYVTKDKKTVKGLLDATIENHKKSVSGAKILRQDVSSFAGGVPVVVDPKDPILQDPVLRNAVQQNPSARNNLGLVAVRYTSGAKHFLTQQAILQANEQLYYILTLTTPGSDAVKEDAPEDPGERAAVDSFRMVVDSVHLLDLVRIRKDQDERLLHTRALFPNFTAQKLRAAIVPEQWFRIMRNGKDIGFTCVSEQLAVGIPKRDLEQQKRMQNHELRREERDQFLLKPQTIVPGDDILIGIRARATSEGIRSDRTRGPIRTDGESWYFITADRQHEDWSKLTVLDDQLPTSKGKRTFSEEFGSTDRHLVNLRSEAGTMSVSQVSNKINLEPINRDIPPFYLQGAIGHLLPRILPLRVPKAYLFATFVSEAREIMLRYVEVGKEEVVTLGGKTESAIPVSDRIGLEGAITVHYLKPQPDAEGHYKYLGSLSKQTGIEVVATDATTVDRIWSNMDAAQTGGASQPGGVVQPASAAAVNGGAAVSGIPARGQSGNRPAPR